MKFRVLLIDDEPSALEGLLMWIKWENMGFEVCGTCSDGQEGLERMKELEPDLVITDVNMPRMNGLEMVEAWRKEEGKSIKFVILSGYSEFEYAKKAMSYGINHYLMKPIFPEEATEELKEIYDELEQEARKANLNQMASSEEVVSLIKGLLNEKEESRAEEKLSPLLTKLAEGKSHWNFCLVQTDPTLNERIREKTASIIRGKKSIFLIDLEVSLFGIVYAYSINASEDNEMAYVLTSLREGFLKSSVYIALGARVSSLHQIANSYRTAKEALMHYFYSSDYVGIISYQSIQDHPFRYQYDHVQLMDDLIRPLNTLDLEGFKLAVNSATRSFREMRIAPEVVKKIVIHSMYKILEFSTETRGAQKSSLLAQITIPEMRDSMITLNDLIDHLLSCGGIVIELLRKEQNERSQGIVQEINKYIEEHYRKGLTIKGLSEIFFMHPVYLGQLLMKKNGINFNEQLHTLRIKEATRLLQENKLKNSEIAEEVGYSNYGQFLKQFEKRMKMSPNEYKQIKP